MRGFRRGKGRRGRSCRCLNLLGKVVGQSLKVGEVVMGRIFGLDRSSAIAVTAQVEGNASESGA